MKANIIVLAGCLSILMSLAVFADQPRSRCCYTEADNGCRIVRCKENPCYCTDPGWKYNTCMTKEKYCAAFGNIGAMDD